ncbi:MAG TPA: hypothetical protein VF161_10485 [Steroidobacteraceae bacterium]
MSSELTEVDRLSSRGVEIINAILLSDAPDADVQRALDSMRRHLDAGLKQTERNMQHDDFSDLLGG